jgi:hypothetical protein
VNRPADLTEMRAFETSPISSASAFRASFSVPLNVRWTLFFVRLSNTYSRHELRPRLYMAPEPLSRRFLVANPASPSVSCHIVAKGGDPTARGRQWEVGRRRENGA